MIKIMCACAFSFYPFSLLIYSNNKTDAPKYNFYNYILINAIPDN